MKERTQRQEADGEKGGAQHSCASLRRALQLIRPLGNMKYFRSLGNMKSDNLRVFIILLKQYTWLAKQWDSPDGQQRCIYFYFFSKRPWNSNWVRWSQDWRGKQDLQMSVKIHRSTNKRFSENRCILRFPARSSLCVILKRTQSTQ